MNDQQERLFEEQQGQQYDNPQVEEQVEVSQGESEGVHPHGGDEVLSPEEHQARPGKQVPEDPRVDWKAKAIEAQTRLQMLEQQKQAAAQQQQVPQQPQRDEVQELREQIEAKKAEMPALDDKNPQTFWQRERAKEEISGLQEKLYDARLRQQENYLLEQQVGTVVNSYKARHAQRPEFKAVEQQFNAAVQNLQPHLRGNETMLEMIRKNLEYDYMQQNRNQRKAPPQAPGSAYTPQAQANPNQGRVKWKSAEDQRVGEYYMQRGIISGPEEFYDPKYNERTEDANNNGVPIYDIPSGKRGWRR